MYRIDHVAYHLKRSEVRLVLDVGANTGQFAMELFRNGFDGTIVSFEPLSSAHKRLRARARGNANWIVAPRCAIGARSGTATINISANSYSSSLRPLLTQHLSAAPASQYVGSEDVPVQTLAQYLADHYGSEPPTLGLKIDTQGYEDEVLAGLGPAIERCVVALVELPLGDLYGGAADLPTLWKTLQNAGLHCVGVSPGHRHPLTRDAIEIDALYVRPADQPAAGAPPNDDFHLFTSIPPRLSRLNAEGEEVGGRYQRACVQSWLNAGFKVVSLNAKHEVSAVRRLGFPIEVIAIDGDHPRPRIADFISCIRQLAPKYCGIVNADCKMLDYPEVALALRSGVDRALLIAERIELIDGILPMKYVPGGFDLFLFYADDLEGLEAPPHAIGEAWWDFWFPAAMAAKGVAVRNINTPLITHFKHDTAWPPEQWQVNARAFWRDLRRWHDLRPETLDDLDYDLARWWERDELDPEKSGELGRIVHRWLHEKKWEPPTPMLSPSPEVEDLLRLYREQSGMSADLAHLSSTLKSFRRSILWPLSKPMRLWARRRARLSGNPMQFRSY